jgi:hypothetical protein
VKQELRGMRGGWYPYLIAEDRDTDVPFLIDPRVVDLRLELHLSVTPDKGNQGDRCNPMNEVGKHNGEEAKITVSMMSQRSCAKGRAKRAWNYRRCFEWKVFGKVEVELKGSAFVWALGLVDER